MKTNKIWNHHRSKPLITSVREFLDWVHQGEKTHHKCWWHHSMVWSPAWGTKEKGLWAPESILLCFSTANTTWPAFSCSTAMPSLTSLDCILSNCEPHKPSLPPASFLSDIDHSNEKMHYYIFPSASGCRSTLVGFRGCICCRNIAHTCLFFSYRIGQHTISCYQQCSWMGQDSSPGFPLNVSIFTAFLSETDNHPYATTLFLIRLYFSTLYHPMSWFPVLCVFISPEMSRYVSALLHCSHHFWTFTFLGKKMLQASPLGVCWMIIPAEHCFSTFLILNNP